MNSNEKKAYDSLSLGEDVIDVIMPYLKKGAEEFARYGKRIYQVKSK